MTPSKTTDMQQILDTVYGQCDMPQSYHRIYPTVARSDVQPTCFALAIATTDGEVYVAGDSDQLFALQSISKVFTYGMALEEHGRDYMLSRVGVEPTGRQYNAVYLEETTGRPYNPMVNAGAIRVADILYSQNTDLADTFDRVMHKLSQYAGKRLPVDASTFTYEFQTDHRNRAIAHLMRSAGAINHGIDDVLHLYFQQCSVQANVAELAMMGATIANGGVHPKTGEQVLSRQYVRDVLSVMHSNGMYDSSGEWSYRVGIPAKSGVSGGILGIVNGRIAIASYSPPLNRLGHSIRGVQAFERLSEMLHLHIFDVDVMEA